MLNPKKKKKFYSYDVLRQIHLNLDMFYKSLNIYAVVLWMFRDFAGKQDKNTYYYFITMIMTNIS